jgi:pSer/pThr/pTyr-binding forkhead associated (FHA) protein
MQILIRKGPGEGRAINLCQARLTVGRTGESDIALQGDWLVSRRHCEIVRRGSTWAVVDVGSKNGTLLNGRPISVPTVLRHGDAITIGSSELVFLIRPWTDSPMGCLPPAGAGLAAWATA